MKYIGELLLTTGQRSFIRSLINLYGTDEYQVTNETELKDIPVKYVEDLIKDKDLPIKLSPLRQVILAEVAMILIKNIKFFDVKPNTLWDYDRSLCHSRKTIGLRVKEVSEKSVKFYDDMAYESYGIEYFDGKTFKPHIKK